MSDLMPEWFPSVPIFAPTDSSFDIWDYFDDEPNDGFLRTNKIPENWGDFPEFELKAVYKDFAIFCHWDNTVLVSDGSLAFETEIEFGYDWEEEAQAVAQKFIDALCLALPSPGQLPLPIEVSV